MNEERTVITDLSQLRKIEENEPYLKFAESIIKEIEQGKTRDEVVHMILAARGGLTADPREMKYFTDAVDIVYRWYYKNKGKEFHKAVSELLDKMDENQKYLYKGKDGKDYATRAELEAANEQYNNQMYKHNSTKNM